jgi:gamma-glutamylcyclotransferase
MYYFAYASNLNKKQMKERCPNAKPVSVVTLSHYRLVFVGWSRRWRGGYANIQPFRGEKVIGAVYEVSEDDMKKLDKYEDCPGTYSRINVILNDDFGRRIDAVSYIRAGRAEAAPPSKEYLAVIEQGCRDWGIL